MRFILAEHTVRLHPSQTNVKKSYNLLKGNFCPKGEAAGMAEFWLITIGLILGRLLVGGMLVLAGVLKLKAGSRWFLQQILAYELVRGRE